MASTKTTDFDIENSEDVELHRANSLNNSNINIDFLKNEIDNNKESTLSYNATHSTSFCSSIGYMKIEIVMFLYMFSYTMRTVTSTTMIIVKACVVHFGYSTEICADLSKHEDIKKAVEKLANNYSLAHYLISLVPSSILACLIGSWSDKYGRKIPLMMAFLGVILDGLGSSICAHELYTKIDYYLIPAIFSGLSGGIIGVMTVVYSYAADTTEFSKRTTKYAIVEMIFGFAMPLGILAGGWMFKLLGYTYVFMISTGFQTLGLVCVIFLIKETRGLDNEDSWKVKLRNLIFLQQFIASFKATNKKLPNKGREQILWLIVGMSCVALSLASTVGINYLYVYHQYNWSHTTYSTVTGIFSIVGIIAMLISVSLFKKFKFGDPILGLVGSISLFVRNIAIGLAMKETVYYFANLSGLFTGLCSLAVRSTISKIASKNDIGKVFAFLLTAESLLPILSTAVVSQVYNATLDFFPGLIYLLMGAIILIPIGVFVWLTRLPHVNYEENYKNPEECEKTTVYNENENIPK